MGKRIRDKVNFWENKLTKLNDNENYHIINTIAKVPKEKNQGKQVKKDNDK